MLLGVVLLTEMYWGSTREDDIARLSQCNVSYQSNSSRHFLLASHSGSSDGGGCGDCTVGPSEQTSEQAESPTSQVASQPTPHKKKARKTSFSFSLLWTAKFFVDEKGRIIIKDEQKKKNNFAQMSPFPPSLPPLLRRRLSASQAEVLRSTVITTLRCRIRSFL